MPSVQIPDAFRCLFQPARYKILYGGRGGAKSWNIARALLILASAKPLRILCARELQISIADSVHRTLCDQIEIMGLSSLFRITNAAIYSTSGSEFIFKGLRHNAHEIKSIEGVDICWFEEAQRASDQSLQLLIPTIRKPGSEIWFSFNPEATTDPVYQRFVVSPPPDAIIRKVNWSDNPWFPDVLDAERRYMLNNDPVAYQHVWEGDCVTLSNAIIFRDKCTIEAFATPAHVERFFFGADWGFATDPTALVRMFIQDGNLYIDHEAVGYGIEIDHLPALFDKVPGARQWPIKADGARPETISYMARQGFRISAAEKWPGSVEDGIEYMRGFPRIIIHERCKHTAQESRLYSYKRDRQTDDILPLIVDANNHCIDAARYGLDGYVRNRKPSRALNINIMGR